MQTKDLKTIAGDNASKSYHGNVMGLESNLDTIIQYFPGWTKEEWDYKWCAAFVYHCVRLAGYDLPVRYEDERIPCNFAGCIAWEVWANLPENQCYHQGFHGIGSGDIVLYDQVFCQQQHDHIGIVLEVLSDGIRVAEGNLNNVSGIVHRPLDHHIRGYIRMPVHKEEEDAL